MHLYFLLLDVYPPKSGIVKINIFCISACYSSVRDVQVCVPTSSE